MCYALSSLELDVLTDLALLAVVVHCGLKPADLVYVFCTNQVSVDASAEQIDSAMWAECAGFLGQSRARRVATYSDGTTITGPRLRASGKAAVYLLAASDTADSGGHHGIEGRVQRQLSAANGNKWGVETGGALLIYNSAKRADAVKRGVPIITMSELDAALSAVSIAPAA